MTITVTCDKYGKEYSASEDKIGKKATCRCGNAFVVEVVADDEDVWETEKSSGRPREPATAQHGAAANLTDHAFREEVRRGRYRVPGDRQVPVLRQQQPGHRQAGVARSETCAGDTQKH